VEFTNVNIGTLVPLEWWCFFGEKKLVAVERSGSDSWKVYERQKQIRLIILINFLAAED
jgi:hypothetical protein